MSATTWVRVMALLAVATPPGVAMAQSDSIGTGTVSLTNLPAYASPFIGIGGGTITVASCPPGRTAVGLAGSRLKFISKLTPLCATVNKDGSFSSVAPVDPTAVAPNATGFTLQCAAGRVASGVGVAYHDNTATYPYLGGVQVLCASWSLDRWAIPPQPIATTGYDGWPRKASVSCSQMTQPTRGLQVRATTSVKAVGITCDEPY